MNQSFNLQGQNCNRGGSGGSSYHDNQNNGSDIQAGSHIDYEQ